MAIYGHIYSYMQHLGAREVHQTSSQCIYNQEAGACYTKLMQLWCSAINFHTESCSASPATLTHGKTIK